MKTKINSFLKVALILMLVGIWSSEILNYSIVGQVKAQDEPFVNPEDVFDQYMESFDREQTVLERESNKQTTRESIVEDIVIEAEMSNPEHTDGTPLTIP
ncbi:MAG: hypothetical protein G3M70_14105 [Candidatus Nitronauta litoralis]|uniref:Uncharacterized protein n=1 Tax=Candidatus Nitronauta litoralis TaxID=2705533 RepID=A0A7T0G107_9BACT|nr:MAG: hypothetical protein G3M70_14105 [Candidatus Nitronauta litoralis]